MKKPNIIRGFLRPEVILILLALGLATAALFPWDINNSIDIHLHDTYYVIAIPHMCMLLSVPFAFAAVIYFLTRNFRQWTVLKYLHLLSLGMIPVLLYLHSTDFQMSYYPSSPEADFGRMKSANLLTLAVALIFVLGQVAFLVNIIAGFIRGKKSAVPQQ
ncbi:hypothetical protein [Chitinophaga rhizosphaerae]|uniref:hypothetical protein n=1 Tax=Chitinophaga rhizosphaerae TaxID=1864947 RepID=UPI000F7FF868|nr:hypothetical protein [Chitinophaga rhizosphaerae]